jgi:hypothetical protein
MFRVIVRLILNLLSLIADIIAILPFFDRLRYRILVPSQPEAADLVWLVNHLGKMLGRLGSSQNETIRKIEHDLGSVLWNVYTGVLPYVEIYSKSRMQQASALRNLSQVVGDEEIKTAEAIINGIALNPLFFRGTRDVAKVALEEIRKRKEMTRSKTIDGVQT